jgi:hypothetical protein
VHIGNEAHRSAVDGQRQAEGTGLAGRAGSRVVDCGAQSPGSASATSSNVSAIEAPPYRGTPFRPLLIACRSPSIRPPRLPVLVMPPILP